MPASSPALWSNRLAISLLSPYLVCLYSKGVSRVSGTREAWSQLATVEIKDRKMTCGYCFNATINHTRFTSP